MEQFSIYKSKREGVNQEFDLNDPVGRLSYFKAKAQKQIEDLKQYLDNHTFVGFMLAKKAAGKGTRAKMFKEIIGSDRVAHIAVGDIVRAVHEQLEDEQSKQELTRKIEDIYRGPVSIEDAVDAVLGRSTKNLSVPTEFLLALLKIHIEKVGRDRALFIDGFPRDENQVSYSLFFREIMNLRPDPDFFILIHTPERIIDARLKHRVTCPICQTSRNLELHPTKFVDYDRDKEQFVLKCDNPQCSGFGEEAMTPKEGDKLGIEAIRDRLEADENLIKYAANLRGVPKIKLRSDVSVEIADEYVDKYEITPKYSYRLNEESGEVDIIETPWVVKNDQGVDSYSLLAPTDVLALIDKLHSLLC